MRSIRYIALTLVAVLALVSCQGNPEAAKKRYVESGDKYFNKARYKEARIQYLNAARIDQKYGLAHYKLGLTYLKLDPPELANALKSLRRGKELIPLDKPEHWDAVVKLTEIYLLAVNQKYDQPFMDEIEKNLTAGKDTAGGPGLLTRDPNSFDGHRLKGDWDLMSAKRESSAQRKEEGQKFVDAALAEYRKADSIKPGDPGVSMQLATVLSMKPETIDAAEQTYRKVIDQKKDLMMAYRNLYILLWGQNKRKDAEQLLKTGYQNNPKEYVFLTSLAQQYAIEKRRDDMLDALSQLKSKFGEYPKAYLDVGDFYLRVVGDGESAIREYREGMGKDVKNTSTYQKRIVEVRVSQNKMAEANEVNEEILKANANDVDARDLKAVLLLDKGDVANAITGLQQMVARAPDNPVAHYRLGRAYFLHNDLEQARQQFQKAIDIRPDYTPAIIFLARLQVKKGDYEEAIRTANRILNPKVDPNNVDAKLTVSAALLGQKKFGEARQMLEAMLKTNPVASPDILLQIGVASLLERKFKDAEDAFRRSYELRPDDTRGLMGVVETYMAQNKPDQAIQILQAEIAKTPARSEFHVLLGNVCRASGRWDMAIAQFQTVLSSADKKSATQGHMYLLIGDTQRLKGDFNAAIVSFQAARQTLPEDLQVLSSLALTLDGAGKWPEAEKVYQAVNKIYPNEAVPLNNLAFGMAEHNEDLDQALSLAQRAKQISGMPEISDTLGWIYLKKFLPDNAIQIFQDLVDKNPNQTTFRFHLGMALSQKGDKVRALQELRKALAGSPSDQERKQIQAMITRLG